MEKFMASTSQAEEASGVNETRNWLELPCDCTSFILSKLGAVEILTAAQNVCTTWRHICKDQAMWRRIDLLNLEHYSAEGYNLEALCCHAVDRSYGELEYFNVELHCIDSVLNYVADRSSSLRHLRLVSCEYNSSEALIEAFAKLSMLEEVVISDFDIPLEALEAIGRSCPLLKTFKYNSSICFDDFYFGADNESALVIATTMHDIHHLQLFRSGMNHIGLSAILDGCPRLESLDLRGCLNLKIVGDLEKRCFDQIKVILRPDDSIDDYEFSLLGHGTPSKKEMTTSNRWLRDFICSPIEVD